MKAMQDTFCYAEGDEGAKYCGDPKSRHHTPEEMERFASCSGQEKTAHLVYCMKHDHLIHHKFAGEMKQDSDRMGNENSVLAVVAEIRQRWANFVNFRQDPAITSGRRMADIDTLATIVNLIAGPSLALCRQLRTVHDDPKYRNVWEIAQLHCGQYAGSTYIAQLAALETVLGLPAYPTTSADSGPQLNSDRLDDPCIRKGCAHSQEEHALRYCTVADCDCRKFVGKQE